MRKICDIEMFDHDATKDCDKAYAMIEAPVAHVYNKAPFLTHMV
jgi:hypothetical protein